MSWNILKLSYEHGEDVPDILSRPWPPRYATFSATILRFCVSGYSKPGTNCTHWVGKAAKKEPSSLRPIGAWFTHTWMMRWTALKFLDIEGRPSWYDQPDAPSAILTAQSHLSISARRITSITATILKLLFSLGARTYIRLNYKMGTHIMKAPQYWVPCWYYQHHWYSAHNRASWAKLPCMS